MSTCLILRLGDFLVYRVTTAKSRQSPKEFIVGKWDFFIFGTASFFVLRKPLSLRDL